MYSMYQQKFSSGILSKSSSYKKSMPLEQVLNLKDILG